MNPVDPASVSQAIDRAAERGALGVLSFTCGLVIFALIVLWRKLERRDADMTTLIKDYHAMASDLKVMAEKWLAALK